MSTRLEFSNVGRGKRSWSVPLDGNPLDGDSIEAAAIRAVRKSGALMSGDIDAVLNDPDGGIILAGVRTVGQFRIVEGT